MSNVLLGLPGPVVTLAPTGYYGMSLIVASETVLFVSLAAHACQFGFLVYFENPRSSSPSLLVF